MFNVECLTNLYYQRDGTDCPEGLEIWGFVFFEKNKRACFLTNRTNQGRCPWCDAP